MKPQLLKVPYEPHQSFGVRKDMKPNINNRWHYHSEVELIHFHKGQGTQFIGDNIKQFGPGDIVMVGSNLPHFWKFENYDLGDSGEEEPYSTVIHFFENFIGERFLHLPEARPVKNFLEKARRGVVITGTDSEKAAGLIEKVYQTEGLYKIIALIECLCFMASSGQVTELSSIGYKYEFPESENKRINAIYNYTLKNFQRKIQLAEVAEIAGMIPNSFCRYFKHYTGKSYFDFLTDIRIGYACKLLVENKLSVKQVCYECGYRNFSCFHKIFKEITGRTPMLYKQQFETNG
jgi:AraC-like DNA-binding protein